MPSGRSKAALPERGTPEAASLLRRLEARLEPDGDCLVWRGATTGSGYGCFTYLRTTFAVHRAVYLLAVGDIGPGLHVDHLCRNKLCCASAHLEPVTPLENTQRGLKGRLAPETCLRGHRLDDPDNQVIEVDGFRRCKACRRIRGAAYSRAWRARQKAST